MRNKLFCMLIYLICDKHLPLNIGKFVSKATFHIFPLSSHLHAEITDAQRWK